jgi:hypothetical protein
MFTRLSHVYTCVHTYIYIMRRHSILYSNHSLSSNIYIYIYTYIHTYTHTMCRYGISCMQQPWIRLRPMAHWVSSNIDFMREYTCIYVYTYIYMSVYTSAYVYKNIDVHLCTNVPPPACVCVCVQAHIYIHAHACIHPCISTSTHIYVHASIVR